MSHPNWKWIGFGVVLLFLSQAFEQAAFGKDSKKGECPDTEFGCAILTDQMKIATILEDFIGGRQGVELAVAQQGALLGLKISLDNRGHGCDFDGVAQVAQDLTADPGIVAVIGTSCSGAAFQALPILSTAGYLTISPSNTGDFLTDPLTHESFYFRDIYPDNVQGTTMADFARNQLQANTAATVYYGSESAQLQEAFSNQFQQSGGGMTAQISIEGHFDAFDCTDIDFSPVIKALGNPDFIYIPLFNPDGACFLQQLRQMNIATTVGAPDYLFDPFLFDIIGPDPLNFYISNAKNPDGPHSQQYARDYKNYFGSEPQSNTEAYAYDATNLVFNAIKKVGIKDKKEGTVLIPRGALRDAMYEVKNYPGATGHLSCDQNGDCNLNSVGIYRPEEGKFIQIDP